MLHMVVATHGPETCSYVSEKIRILAIESAKRVNESAKAKGCKIVGAWSSRANHTLYFVVDGPNAHMVEQLIFDLRFHEWQSTSIQPVFDMNEAVGGLGSYNVLG